MHPTFPSYMFRPWVREVKILNKSKDRQKYHGALAENMLGLQLADQLSGVITSILGNDGRQLSEKQEINAVIKLQLQKL